MSKQDEFNLDDYEPVEELDVQLLNVFLCYFKQVFHKDGPVNMFSEVDNSKEDSTNRCMEMFYEEMIKYNSRQNDPRMVDILKTDDVDIKHFKELYMLSFNNGEEDLYSQSLMSLIYHLSKIDWANTSWNILPLKTEKY